MRPSRRLRASHLLLALALPVALTVGSQDASQQVSARDLAPVANEGEWKTWKMPFTRSGQRWIKDLRTCVEWKVTGDIRWTVKKVNHSPLAFSYKNPRLVDPSITIWTYDRCVASYTDYRRVRWVDDIRLGAKIYGNNKRTCRWNSSFGIGFPFAASLSVTPECDETKVAGKWWGRVIPNDRIRSASEGVDGIAQKWEISDYTQVSFDGGTHRVCFRPVAGFKVWRTIDGQSIARSKTIRVNQVCRDLYDAVR